MFPLIHPKKRPAYRLALLLLGWSVAVQAQSIPADYRSYIHQQRQQREASLQSDDGWLNLAGLFWLKPGRNTFGADRANAIVFPAGRCAPQLGALILKDGEVWIEANEGQVFHQGKPIQNLQLYGKGVGKMIVLEHRALRWFVIQRGDRFGIRLRDLESPAVMDFPGLDYFPIDPAWRLEATLEPGPPGKQLPIMNVLGQTSMQDSPGTLVFMVQGKEYRLDAVLEGDRLFLIFSDATAGESTYGGGRFLYAAMPGPDGKTVLDFNLAENPPCAFTEFATCPVPPPQNVLPLAIEAGEKAYGAH